MKKRKYKIPVCKRLKAISVTTKTKMQRKGNKSIITRITTITHRKPRGRKTRGEVERN